MGLTIDGTLYGEVAMLLNALLERKKERKKKKREAEVLKRATKKRPDSPAVPQVKDS